MRLLPTLILSVVFFAFPVLLMAQTPLWSDVSPANARSLTAARNHLPTNFRLIKLNRQAARQLQSQAPFQGNNARRPSNAKLYIPIPGDSNINTSLVESPILSKELQKQHPDIKTYELVNNVTGNLEGRLTISSAGITGMIFSERGNLYISPVGESDPDVHMVYFLRDLKSDNKISCGTSDELVNLRPAPPARVEAGDCMKRTFRIAIAATGEYTTWAGGSQANALNYIAITVNDVAAIYQRELNVAFTLVSNNSIIFTDATTDPYATITFPDNSTLIVNDNTLATNIGNANFDLGMVFNKGWDGGLAYVAEVCQDGGKGLSAAGLSFGAGYNSTAGPQGPLFASTVAHEIGHLFSATHTFSATNGACGGQLSLLTAYEPGGGSTLMAYASSCTGNFDQVYEDPYFHAGSLAQIQNYVTASATCAAGVATGNNPPVVSVPANSYTVPVLTPFMLSATGSDADGNTLYYTWDQMDAGSSASAPAPTNTTGPAFRSYPPVTLNYRYFPRLEDVLNNTSSLYEVLPSVSRTLNFRTTVRDRSILGGCTAEADVTVNTNSGAGPFYVSSQSTSTTWTADGVSTATITWNVANTTSFPVHCLNVNILFSVDGGFTYPYTLAANTPNDGSETVTIPNLATTTGRIKVEAADNIFFDLNDAPVTITSSCNANAASIAPVANVTASSGSSALDLNLAPQYGSAATFSGALSFSDGQGALAVNNNSAPNCWLAPGNNYYYDAYPFVVNAAGNYTFSLTGAFGTIFNVYKGSFLPNMSCNGFLGSNGTFNGSLVNVSPGFTVALDPRVPYVLTVGSFSANLPDMTAGPVSYTITATPPAGANVYTSAPNPGAGYNYTYVIVDNATGNVKAFDAGADLSNASNFPAGTYTVYGLSYSTSISSSTLNSYIGQPFATLQQDLMYNTSVCGSLSRNAVSVIAAAPLPVTMLPLKALKDGKVVRLKWTTASEQNSHHFEILRSTDSVDFAPIPGTIPASGFSQTFIDYQSTDLSPAAGWNYYKVKEVDNDGSFSYSTIAAVHFGDYATALTVYPNPVASTLSLEYTGNSRTVLQVHIFDAKGALLMRRSVASQAGRNMFSFSVAGLAKGIYAVEVVSPERTITSRFVKE